MFNLKTLKIRKESQRRDSFVGIRRTVSQELEFCLPYGFDNFPDHDFYAIKRFFFRMYKTFRKFVTENCRIEESNRNISRMSDGIIKTDKGLILTDKQGEEIIIYSKIAMIDSVLKGYDELAIASIINKISRREDVDYSKIDHYMHKAIYLADNVIYIDEMELPQHRLAYSSTDLVEMFCFIFKELKTELEELDEVNDETNFLAQQFKEKHLTANSSLFDENEFERTLSILKEILDHVQRNTAYKDADFWHFFEAIEHFLYGETDSKPDMPGDFWGVSTFSLIWEDMCHVYMFSDKELRDLIIYADSKRYCNQTIGGQDVYVDKKVLIDVPFYVEYCYDKNEQTTSSFMSKQEYRRFLRPDLVRLMTKTKSVDERFKDLFEIHIEKRENSQFIDVHIKLNRDDKQSRNMYNFFIEQLHKGKTGYRSKKGYFPSYPQRKYEEIEQKLKRTIQPIAQPQGFIILDYKYLPVNAFTIETLSPKVKQDLTKQLIYEYALQLKFENAKTENQFCIPYFYEDFDYIGDDLASEQINPEIRDNYVKVFKVNFMKLQGIYLEN